MGLLGFFSGRKAAKRAIEEELDHRVQELEAQDEKNREFISSQLDNPLHPLIV